MRRWAVQAAIATSAAVAAVALVPALAGPAAAGEGSGLPPSDASPAEVREQADEILSRPEFDEPGETIAERVFGWIGDRLEDLLSGLGVGGAGGQAVLGWIALALLGGLVVFLLVRLWRSGRLAERLDADGTTSTRVVRSSTDWLKAAEEAEAEGRWRVGLRCRYRALARELVLRGVLDEIPGRTTGEHRIEVAERAPAAAAPFAGAAELFDRAWYGNRPTGAEESARFRSLAAEVLERAAAPDRRPADDLDLVAPR